MCVVHLAPWQPSGICCRCGKQRGFQLIARRGGDYPPCQDQEMAWVEQLLPVAVAWPGYSPVPARLVAIPLSEPLILYRELQQKGCAVDDDESHCVPQDPKVQLA